MAPPRGKRCASDALLSPVEYAKRLHAEQKVAEGSTFACCLGPAQTLCCGASTARSERGHATSQRGSHPPAAPHPPRDGAAGVTVSNPAGAGCGGRLRAEAPGLVMT